MNTRYTLAGLTLAVGLVGLGTHTAGAQEQNDKSLILDSSDKVTVSYDRFSGGDKGHTQTYTLQGHVRLRRPGGGAVDLTTTPTGFVIPTGGVQGRAEIIAIPMDMATLKVSVTPAGTVFTDGKNDSLTVETSVTAP